MQRRRQTHPVYLAMAVVLLVLVVTSGCAVPGYNERDAMLFEDKIHTEFKTGGFTPNSEHFSGGSGFGLKVNYEYEYGMHFGFEFDTVDNVEGQPFARTASETVVDHFANDDNIRSVERVRSRARIAASSWSALTGTYLFPRKGICRSFAMESESVD